MNISICFKRNLFIVLLVCFYLISIESSAAAPAKGKENYTLHLHNMSPKALSLQLQSNVDLKSSEGKIVVSVGEKTLFTEKLSKLTWKESRERHASRKAFPKRFFAEFNVPIQEPVSANLNAIIEKDGTPYAIKFFPELVLSEAGLISISDLKNKAATMTIKEDLLYRADGRQLFPGKGHLRGTFQLRNINGQSFISGWGVDIRSFTQLHDIVIYYNDECIAVVEPELFLEDLPKAFHTTGVQKAGFGIPLSLIGEPEKLRVYGITIDGFYEPLNG